MKQKKKKKTVKCGFPKTSNFMIFVNGIYQLAGFTDNIV